MLSQSTYVCKLRMYSCEINPDIWFAQVTGLLGRTRVNRSVDILNVNSTRADADSFAVMLKDPKIVEVRRMKLQTYLRLVIAQLSRDFPELIERASRQTLVQTVPFFSYVSTEQWYYSLAVKHCWSWYVLWWTSSGNVTHIVC